MNKGAILIISGPSGSGKSSLVKSISQNIEDIYFSVSSTTRQKREGEEDGINYHFVDEETFKQDISDGMFLEWARVHGNYYGTSLKPILKAIKEGKLVVFDIDVQGHKIAKAKLENVITSVFITTPSISALKQRLVERGTDTQEVIQRRLNNALSEMTSIQDYDFLLINDQFEKACEELLAIAKVAKLKSSLFDTETIMGQWDDEA